jgi:hypothetical protein
MITYEVDKVAVIWECTDEDCECGNYRAEVPVTDIAEIGVPICPDGLDMEPIHVLVGSL